jgi:hypothetical protein
VAGAAHEAVGDLRPESDTPGECFIEEGEPNRNQRAKGHFAPQELVDSSAPERLKKVTGAQKLGADALVHADSDCNYATEHQQPRTTSHGGEPVVEHEAPGA